MTLPFGPSSRAAACQDRARALDRLASLLERGVPLPAALLGAGESLTGRARARAASAAAAAGEGRPLVDALLSGGLVEPGERALLEAVTGADPATTLRLLAQELSGRAALAREVELGLRAPLRHALGVLVALAVFALVGSVMLGTFQGVVALALGTSGARGWATAAALLFGLLGLAPLALLALTDVALAWLVRSSLVDPLAGLFPALHRLLGLHTASTFLRRLGLALQAGRSLPLALETAAAAFGDRPVAREVAALARRAREGAGLRACLGQAPFLDPSAELVAKEAADRADPPRELLALAQVYAAELALEARALGPLLGGCAEVLMTLPVAGLLAAGFSALGATIRMMAAF